MTAWSSLGLNSDFLRLSCYCYHFIIPTVYNQFISSCHTVERRIVYVLSPDSVIPPSFPVSTSPVFSLLQLAERLQRAPHGHLSVTTAQDGCSSSPQLGIGVWVGWRWRAAPVVFVYPHYAWFAWVGVGVWVRPFECTNSCSKQHVSWD